MKEKYFKYIIEELFKRTQTFISGNGMTNVLFPFLRWSYHIDTVKNSGMFDIKSFVMYEEFQKDMISIYGVNLKDTEELFVNYLKYVRENIDRLTPECKITSF